MKKTALMSLILACVFAFCGCGEDFLSSVVREYAGEEGAEALNEQWDEAKEEYKENAKEGIQSEIDKSYDGEDKAETKEAADKAVDIGFELVDDLIDSLSGELHSPVPEGCTFSGPSEDYGKDWYGHHDIMNNVKEGKTPVYAVADGKIAITQIYITVGGANHYVSYGNKIELFCDDNSEDITNVIYAHLHSYNTELGIDNKLYSMAGSIGGSSSKIKQQYGKDSIQKNYVTKELKVKKGQVLGYVGNTGNSSGAHLHIEVYKGKTRVDPTEVFDGLI